MPYERENIRAMSGYVPGEQPESADVVKLNTNENPYPPADAVVAALRTIRAEQLRRYPNPTARAFREAAAEAHGVEAAQIIATNGGDELLRLLITTFVDPGERVGMAEPSYSLYPVLAAVQDAGVFRVPLDEKWHLPADFADRLNDVGARVTFVVNPHAPSGRLTTARDLGELAGKLDGLLVIDEAYVDFVDPHLGHDTLPLVAEHGNVVLLRSLSKGYSLAGLRFGYGIGPAALIEPMLTKTKDSYNTDAVSQALATAAIESRRDAAASWNRVREERRRMRAELQTLGFAIPDSQSNFLLAGVPDEFAGGARAVYNALKQRGIFVRYFDQPRLRDKLRVTIGTPDQNHALLAALREL